MKPRVWVVTPELHREGGTERALAEQIARWRSRIDLRVYTMDSRGVPLDGIAVRHLWRPPGPHLVRYLWWFAANHIVRWWDALWIDAPDVVHSPGVNCLDASVISVHIVFAKLWERVRVLLNADLKKPGRLRGLHRMLLYGVYRILENRVFSGPATLWAMSEQDARALETRFGRPPRSVVVIPHGVDVEAFSPGRRLERRGEARRWLGVEGHEVLLLVGNDWHKKGADVAVRALARLPWPVCLAVAGSTDPAPLRKLASSLGVSERLRCWPHTPDVLQYYAAADCVVAPSREDAFHMPALEALACGLPLIISATAGAAELMEHSRHALILEDPEDEVALASLIQRVRDEPGLPECLSPQGRALAEQCSWDLNADRAADLIEREATTPRAIVLATDAWGTGGIERATRSLITALADLYGPERVALLSVWGPGRDHHLPCRALFGGPSKAAGAGPSVSLSLRIRFAIAALRTSRRWRGRNTVIITSHAHLAVVAWAASLLSGCPYCVWAYGQEVWGDLKRALTFAIRRARKIVALGRYTTEVVRERLSIPPAALETVLLPVPSDVEAELVRREEQRCGRPRVLTVARLDHDDAYKGVDTLLLAWPMVLFGNADAELIVVGDGDMRCRLERLATQLSGVGRVRFLGRVDDEQLSRQYAEAHVFALPGRARLGSKPEGEGFGLVFLEAAAAGLPCVAGRAGGAQEAVLDGVTGFLVDPHSPRDVAQAVVRLLGDPALARRMGEAGRARVEQDFSYEAFRARVGDLVAGMLR